MAKTLSDKAVLQGGEEKFTVGLRYGDGTTIRLLKVGYATNDCSYYVFFPYHPYRGKAVLGRFTVNYAHRTQELSFQEMLDIASSEDESNGIKLSHHRSGFVQFSGGGIVSGPANAGVQVQSWALSHPTPGPAFAVTMFSIDGYSRSAISDVACLFPGEDLTPRKESGALIIEGFYFPWEATKHTECTPNGERVITIKRPSDEKQLQMKVLTPPAKCWNLGFLGVHAFLEAVSPNQKMEGFVVTTSTGNLHRNAANEMLADSLVLAYPQIFPPRRNIDYTPPAAAPEVTA